MLSPIIRGEQNLLHENKCWTAFGLAIAKCQKQSNIFITFSFKTAIAEKLFLVVDRCVCVAMHRVHQIIPCLETGKERQTITCLDGQVSLARNQFP